MKERLKNKHENKALSWGRIDPADVGRLLAALKPQARRAGGADGAKGTGEAEGAASPGLGKLTDAEWKNLLSLARRLYLGPLLAYRSERSGSLAAAPESVREELHREYCANAVRNTSFFNRLAVVLRALKDAGVEVIPLKGVHMAELVYRNRALRRIGDADLLVKVEDMAAAERAVRALGYTQKRAASFEAAQEVAQHIPPYKMAGSVDLELHWNIGNPTMGVTVDERGLWERSGRALIGGVEVRVLSPADLLLHLCMHMSVHHLFRGHLRALYDISETLARHKGEIDWEVFRRGCAKPGITKGCWLALTLAAKHAGAEVPREILDGLSGRGPGGEENGAGNGNGDNAAALAAALAAAEELLLYGGASGMSPGVVRLWGTYPTGEKVRHFFRRIFLTRAEMECQYPVKGSSLLIYPFYAWRFVDLLARHSKGAWRMFRHDKKMTTGAADDLKENTLRDWLTR